VAENPRVSIQRTSQRIKRQELLGSILLVVSLVVVQAVPQGSRLGYLLGFIGVLGFIAGLVLLAKARFGRWWCHG